MDIVFHKPILPKSLDELYTDSMINGWLTTGPQVQKFESIISEYTQSKYAVAVNSCTAALHLALAAKNFGIGDKFIAPTYTFVASVEVGEYLGMKPVLVDCDDNYNIDVNQLEELVKSDAKIKAIIPVHFAGVPVNMKDIMYIAHKYGLFVLEDAAHALETVSNIGKVGDTNHGAAFSFYANKNITTGGEGGAFTTNDDKLAEKVRKLSLHGISKDGWNRFKKGAKWKYDISLLGYKYNMTDFAGSFGIWQMGNIELWYKKRVDLAKRYYGKLTKIPGLICPSLKSDNTKYAYHLYIIRIIPKMWKIDRNKIIDLLNANGVGTSVHYTPVHMQSYYMKKYGYKPLDFKKSKLFGDNVISLPLYPLLKNEQIDYIVDCILELWGKYKA